jgi:hypothetical protein
MFGSEVVAEYVYQVASTTPEVTAAVGSRIANLAVVPSGLALPALIHYAEQGDYGGVITAGDDIDSEVVRYVTRFICEGTSTDPVRLAAQRLLRELAVVRPTAQLTYDGQSYFLTFLATGEWPLTTVVEEAANAAVLYRQLGTIWRVEVMRGG